MIDGDKAGDWDPRRTGTRRVLTTRVGAVQSSRFKWSGRELPKLEPIQSITPIRFTPIHQPLGSSISIPTRNLHTSLLCFHCLVRRVQCIFILNMSVTLR